MSHSKWINAVFITFICFKIIATNAEEFEGKIDALTKVIVNDIPTARDMWDYHASLERIIDFWTDQKDDMTLNVMFGLFIVNVNLRRFVHDSILPKFVKGQLNRLLKKNDYVQEYYKYKIINNNTDPNVFHERLMYEFLFSEAKWSQNMVRFNSKLISDTAKSKLVFWDWPDYAKAVDEVDKWTPTPAESDMCLEHLLVLNGPNSMDNQGTCKIPSKCRDIQTVGDTFGYALTHRLIFLLFARNSRSCAVFSPKEDEARRNYYCQIMYREIDFIAHNDFKFIDLVLEQMSLCAFEGHVQFLRRSWIDRLLRYQTEAGCLDPTEPTHSRRASCNDHVTAVGAATVAAAMRLLLENYGRLKD